ncbi:MAG: monovalent cation/H(+) antiporter subunit G [Wenzhouxiangella sp.]|nr:monovalent cation/H(+) antiporter subunit G [Wenzhouxiangella sp.]MCH8478256.1 monovalent cation/H(+) antiporter subunit G [Wenzhouxiangella sp.]TVR94470.1 MAG: sodium:proton antiporter [Wenzhouxiangellaceae bacterium]
MMAIFIDILSWVLLITGGAFGVIGGIGLLRFPDFYTRLHASGITDTLCAVLIVFGLMLQSGLSLLTLKMVLILLFLLFTTPTATHALARAAVLDGLEPKLADQPQASPSEEEPPSKP